MNIEITGLPEGQKIKNISVEISFDGEMSVTAQSTLVEDSDTINGRGEKSVLTNADEPDKQRDPAEIPAEMKDVQY
jgi:hypothetical protein